ncbi:MAG: hypothetical protein KDC11_01630, partial [Chitinophagaceae bacterium]|nr:hypothetical protein [Chitinophagaceae bacterium]
EYPVLQVQEYKDSVSGKQVLLNGSAGDDYSISKVVFHYNILDENKNEIASKDESIKVASGALVVFQQYFDIQTINLKPGQQVNYYIEAWDNDGVNGSKSTRSEVMSYSMYDRNQLDSVLNANAKQISAGLSNSSQRSHQLQNEYRDMQNKLLKSDNMDWEQQQSLQNLMKMQESLQNEMMAVKNRFEEQKKQSEQKQYSDDLKDKMENLDKQMNNLLDKELQEQMKKLQELMAKLNKQDAVKTMQDLEQQNKLFNMDMERMKEMMKRMEMQMRMEDMANKMNELAEKQLALKDKTDKGDSSNEQLDIEQKQLEQELNSAMEQDMKKMDDLNKEMNRPQDMQEAKELAEQAKQDMQQSSQQLQQNQRSGASQSQSQAAENLQQMSQGLMTAASGLNVPQLTKDIKAVRQILSNLIRLSFDQENLMNDIGNVNLASQNYVSLQREQKRLHDNSKMIRDSLFELSKNIEKLAVNVNKETTDLEKNMRGSVASMENRNIGDAAVRQQYVMTHTNNLALMLNELLENLMTQMNLAQKGKPGQCNNPGGMTPKQGTQGQPSPQLSDVITKQKNIGNAMQQMQNAMQRGQQGSKPGEDGQPKNSGSKQQGEGEYGDAEQLARLARQQSELRKQLQELASMLNSEGLGNAAKELREIQEEMDKNETQLVNKRLSSQLFLRQQQILTRLLEAEKSIREQMQDDKRSSKTSKDVSRPLPPDLENLMKNHKQLTEQYKTNQPTLKPYYRSMVENYYKLLGT